MKIHIIAAILATLGSQANALSCAFGNTAQAFLEAQQKGDFQLVEGRFDLPQAGLLFEEEEYTLLGTFMGDLIAPDGSTDWLITPVKVVGACINGDCGYVSPGQTVLTALYQVEDEYVTYSWPCSGLPQAPTDDARAVFLSCMNDGPCDPEFDN